MSPFLEVISDIGEVMGKDVAVSLLNIFQYPDHRDFHQTRMAARLSSTQDIICVLSRYQKRAFRQAFWDKIFHSILLNNGGKEGENLALDRLVDAIYFLHLDL